MCTEESIPSFEIDFEPEIPDSTYALIGRIAVGWAWLENEVQFQCLAEAELDFMDQLREIEKGAFQPRIENRIDAFIKLRRKRLGEAGDENLLGFKNLALETASRRAELLHGSIYLDDGKLKVRHEPTKQGRQPVHIDISEIELSSLLRSVQEVCEMFKHITDEDRPINAHLDES